MRLEWGVICQDLWSQWLEACNADGCSTRHHHLLAAGGAAVTVSGLNRWPLPMDEQMPLCIFINTTIRELICMTAERVADKLEFENATCSCLAS